MHLKTNLSTIMGRQRMSQSELSRRTGIRQATIFLYYNDLWKSIKKEHIEKICEVLNCEITDIFVLEEEETKQHPFKECR